MRRAADIGAVVVLALFVATIVGSAVFDVRRWWRKRQRIIRIDRTLP